MPVTTRSSMRPSAPAAVSATVGHSYSLRTIRPEAGYYAETHIEVDDEMQVAAATLLSMRNAGASLQPIRRSARLAGRS